MSVTTIASIGIVGFWVVIGAWWIGRMYERSRWKDTHMSEEMREDANRYR